jgi:hypothetical protein
MITIEQLRGPKIWNMALFDLLSTFIGAWIVHSLLWFYPLENVTNRTSLQYILSLSLIFMMFVALGVILHRIFGIRSALSAYLGFNLMPVRK